MTLDNKRITVPNGNLMNANIIDYSTEELRRVDLDFSCAKSEDPARVQSTMIKVIEGNSTVLAAPDKPFARASGSFCCLFEPYRTVMRIESKL